MKESFPKVVVEGPTGPYEILSAGPTPSLVVFALPNGLVIVGDRPGLERLARLADLVRERRDTVVSFGLRANALPPNVAEEALDLVLAPEQIAMTPEVWKSIRAHPATSRRRVALPELNDGLDGAQERLEFRQKKRTMNRLVGAETLILSGENVAFRALAGSAAYVARVGENWPQGEEYFVDWVPRDGEPNVRVDYYDPSQGRDEN